MRRSPGRGASSAASDRRPLRRDPEPHLAAVGAELGPVSEGLPVGFPAGGARRQGPGAARPWRRCAGSREDPGVDDPRCRANQHDRVLAGVKPRRYAPPPLRGADGLDTGCAHGHRQSLPDSPGTLFSQEGPEFDVLTEHLGIPFHVVAGVLF